jgi:hypothetical protein
MDAQEPQAVPALLLAKQAIESSAEDSMMHGNDPLKRFSGEGAGHTPIHMRSASEGVRRDESIPDSRNRQVVVYVRNRQALKVCHPEVSILMLRS